jgi:hypothetical protein
LRKNKRRENPAPDGGTYSRPQLQVKENRAKKPPKSGVWPQNGKPIRL